MDGDRRAPPAALVAAVLGDDDLLREILLRLGFPNYLVRAALVCKRWLLHASDPAFLRRFRDRHPPRLLGFCVGYPGTYQLVPLPRSPELATVSRRTASSCNDAFAAGRGECIKHCRNGRLIAAFFHQGRYRYALLSPLLAGEPVATVLPLTPLSSRNWKKRDYDIITEIFLPEDGGSDGVTLLNIWRSEDNVAADVYVLGSGGWGAPATAVTELKSHERGTNFLRAVLPPVHGKVFWRTASGYALGLDLAAASFFTLELPHGVGSNYRISCAEDSGLYLVSTDGFQLNVWLHRMTGDDDGAGGWFLVDTFSVREACARLARHSWVSQYKDFVKVAAVGDNAEFVFLDHAASGGLLYIHLRSRLVEKVYERAYQRGGAVEDDYPVLGYVDCTPFMMSWPPIFPALNGGHDQQG